MSARGVDAAINLDGGGSSSLVVEGKVVSRRPSDEPMERPVANALSVLKIRKDDN